ncbi:L-threonylcarbamoyladenylate synthase [Cytobacillus sp. Hz8]|uniref:L-threonylcarbamoyladenylate synthase n=1 Tax=Cytobacillus sp. Hz8 TaxID=3347168 RepID=UPI0035DF20B9
MKTTIWTVDKNVDKQEGYQQIAQAAHFLKENEVIAFPTETVYGLGGNAKSDVAVAKIFAAKGRPSDNPLIMHIADKNQLKDIVEEIPEKAHLLIDQFWPGPLTIIFRKKEGVLSEKATAGLPTVAVRMPDHPIALALIAESGLPIAAPSANRSGKPSPTTANHVFEDLDGRIPGIVDGGSTGVGVESTVVDCTEEIPTILRPGGITKEQLEAVVGEVRVDPALADENQAPKAPGMKYKHYAPNAPLYLVNGTQSFIQKLVDEKQKQGQVVGVLTTEEHQGDYRADYIFACGRRSDLKTVANFLYKVLRSFNRSSVDVIYSEMFPTEGVGQAIMNRLMKAAGGKIIEETSEK